MTGMRGDETDPTPVLLTTEETAKLLRVSISWLAKSRNGTAGPPFMRFGRSVRYSQEELLRWAKSQRP